jgi:hypothetical protein
MSSLFVTGLLKLDNIWRSSTAGKSDDKGIISIIYYYVMKVRDSAIIVFGIIFGLTWILLCTVPLYQICDVTQFIPEFILVLYNKSVPFHIVSAYGLFRRMTGVGSSTNMYDYGANFNRGLNIAKPLESYKEKSNPSIVARPEIVIEGLSSQGID